MSRRQPPGFHAPLERSGASWRRDPGAEPYVARGIARGKCIPAESETFIDYPPPASNAEDVPLLAPQLLSPPLAPQEDVEMVDKTSSDGSDDEVPPTCLGARVISQPKPARPPQRKRKSKTSFGIACCRYYNGKYELLMVCKRFTHAYNTFVHGRYDSQNTDEIIGLLDGMTVDEKHDLNTLDFNHMWYRVWMDKLANGYYVAKNKFEDTFMTDDGRRLRRLIRCSRNADRLWELPKGRRKTNEPDIQCAVREFYEETNIPKDHYRILPHAKRTHVHVDDGVSYTSVYFYAVATVDIDPRVSFANSEQVAEVSEIRWVSMDELQFVDRSGRLRTLVAPIFNYMRANARPELISSYVTPRARPTPRSSSMESPLLALPMDSCPDDTYEDHHGETPAKIDTNRQQVSPARAEAKPIDARYADASPQTRQDRRDEVARSRDADTWRTQAAARGAQPWITKPARTWNFRGDPSRSPWFATQGANGQAGSGPAQAASGQPTGQSAGQNTQATKARAVGPLASGRSAGGPPTRNTGSNSRLAR